MRKVMVVYGTRPEAIKMAPVVAALGQSEHLEPIVVTTGQHREMLDQVNRLFEIVPKHDLNIIEPRQTLEGVTSRTLAGMTELLAQERPDMVMVQGDTTSCFAAGLAGFYAQVPVAHVEAGLRTDDPYNPFPEEINRRLVSQLAALHLAPTPRSRANLLREGIRPEAVVTTGNTVIDALLATVARQLPYDDQRLEEVVASGRRIVLVTSHRRESWGPPMLRVAEAIAEIARSRPELAFVLPAHLNPVVRETLLPPLAGLPNVLIVEPLSYGPFARLMHDSHLLLTDSGGVQEEGPSLGKPVLVMRETTERPEAVDAGTVRLVGTDGPTIMREVAQLLDDERHYGAMARAVNPYGDGKAAGRTVEAVEAFFGFGRPPAEFAPA